MWLIVLLVKVNWRETAKCWEEKNGGEKGKNLSGVFMAVGQNVVIGKAFFSSLSFRIYKIYSIFLPIYLEKIST